MTRLPPLPPHMSGNVEKFTDENLKDLAKEIESSLMFVRNSNPPLTQDCIISRVNPLLQVRNEAAYRPNFAIIGPLRRYDSILESMEMKKRYYLEMKSASLADFSQLIRQSAPKIQACYEKPYYRHYDLQSHKIQQKISPNDDNVSMLIEMVLVDACFIIELFFRAYNKDGGGQAISDSMFDKPGTMHDFRRDLFLAHNQLPLFILKDIYQLAFRQEPDVPSFLTLTCHFFGPYYNQNVPIEEIMTPNGCYDEYRAKLESAKHFTDLLRTLQVPYSFPKHGDSDKSLCFKLEEMHLVDRISSLLQLPWSKTQVQDVEAGKVQGEYLYSAVLLREAGVTFKASSSKCLLDIKFNKNTGRFEIPPLKLDESTESFFRNLMAWEKIYYPHETRICDYIFLMEYLIKSTEDVDLLVRKRIIINQLGSHSTVVTLFNHLCKNITPLEKNCYSHIFRELNAYNAVRRHSWIAILKLQYFSTPWRGVATVAAAILLVLTLIQTICSLKSL